MEKHHQTSIEDKLYQFYTFSQLFHEQLKDCIENESLESLFPIIMNELEKFEKSEFNDEERSEYDCMENYLFANADTISLTIADHNNL